MSQTVDAFSALYLSTRPITLGLLLGVFCGFGVGGNGWAIRIVYGVCRGAGQPANGHWAFRRFRFLAVLCNDWGHGDTGNIPNAITKAGWGMNVPALYNSRSKTQPMLCALVTMNRDVDSPECCDEIGYVHMSLPCTPYLHASGKVSWGQAREAPAPWSSISIPVQPKPPRRKRQNTPFKQTEPPIETPSIALHEPPTPHRQIPPPPPSNPPMPTSHTTPPNPQLSPSPSPSPPNQHHGQHHPEHQPPTCPSKP